MAHSQTAQRHPVFNYENGLLILLGISFGFAFFDRNSASVLIPYMSKDLALSNTQAALINSVLSIMWALGAYVIARWSDSMGRRKPFLLAFLIIFSACSFLSGLAQSFEVLLISRALMGFVEGPFLPVCLAIMAVESSANRRGVNSGIMQNFFAALLGQSLAPWLLPVIAEEYGWRAAFFVSGVPGLPVRHRRVAVGSRADERSAGRDSHARSHGYDRRRQEDGPLRHAGRPQRAASAASSRSSWWAGSSWAGRSCPSS